MYLLKQFILPVLIFGLEREAMAMAGRQRRRWWPRSCKRQATWRIWGWYMVQDAKIKQKNAWSYYVSRYHMPSCWNPSAQTDQAQDASPSMVCSLSLAQSWSAPVQASGRRMVTWGRNWSFCCHVSVFPVSWCVGFVCLEGCVLCLLVST